MPSRRLHVVLVLSAALVLAGCSLPAGGDASTPSPGAASPTPTDAAPAVDPPGVTNGTLTEPGALLSAHTASLRARGYRLETRVAGSRTVYAAASNFSSFRVASESSPAVWANETLTLARMTRDGETVYRRPPRFWAGPERLSGAALLGTLFDASTYVRDGTAPCGDRTCAVLSASGSPRFANFSAEALIDGSGVVHRVRATSARDGQSAAREVRLTLARLGDVTVERPGWVETAIERTG